MPKKKSLPDFPSDRQWKPFDDIRKVEGQKISIVRDLDRQWKPFHAEGLVPDSAHLFNFEVELEDERKLLVLDRYGDEGMPEDIREFMGLPDDGSQTLGIWKDTGQIVCIMFAREGKKIAIGVHGFPGASWGPQNHHFCVPKKFLSRLDELKSAKRPFDLSFVDYGWERLHSRWCGLKDFEDYLVVKLDLHDDQFLEIGREHHRLVTRWENTVVAKPKM